MNQYIIYSKETTDEYMMRFESSLKCREWVSDRLPRNIKWFIDRI